jgi:predicted transcriptional regulator
MDGLGVHIAQRRKNLGMTQGELSALSRVSLATVQNIEAGRANPALGTVEKMCSALSDRHCF